MQDCKRRIAALQAAIYSPWPRPPATVDLRASERFAFQFRHEKLDLLDFVTILLSTEHDEISPREVFVVPGKSPHNQCEVLQTFVLC